MLKCLQKWREKVPKALQNPSSESCGSKLASFMVAKLQQQVEQSTGSAAPDIADSPHLAVNESRLELAVCV